MSEVIACSMLGVAVVADVGQKSGAALRMS
jgi:hypothetical protein